MVHRRRAVIVVGARFGRYIDDAAARVTKCRRIGRCLDRYFLNGFRRKRHHFTSQTNARVANSIHDHVGRARSAPVDAQIEAGNRHGISINRWIFRSNVSRYVGSYNRQIEHAAVQQRNIRQQTF